MQKDELQVLPPLCSALMNCVDEHMKLENWKETAQNMIKVLKYFELVSENPDFSEHFKMSIEDNCEWIIEFLRGLPEANRNFFYQQAGEDADFIQQLVEDFEKDSPGA
jgi:hypothetical protein